MTQPRTDPVTTALTGLAIIQTLMLFSLFTKTPPHPPVSIPLFGLAPFISAAIAAAVTAIMTSTQSRAGLALTVVATLMALVSFGPHKWFDAAFPQIWPSVIAAQICVVVIITQLVRARISLSRSREV